SWPPQCALVTTEAGSCCITWSLGAAGLAYSYGQRCTSGMAPGQLPWGGGEAVVHSSPLAFQGFSLARGPLKALQKKLMKKMICEAPRISALIVTNWLSGWSGFRNSYW